MKMSKILDGPFPGFGQLCSAAALPALAGCYQWVPGLTVHGINQIPGMLIGHLHGTGGLGNGTMHMDSFQQHNSAKAQKRFTVVFDPDPPPAVIARL